jgi:hypothetical protein
MTDFWPEGIELEDVQSPKEILLAAQEQWRTRSEGVLGLVIRETTSTKGHAMLVVHAKHEPTNRTVNLFSVVHRKTAPYPVTIYPKEDDLPNFLKKSYYSPSFGAGLYIKGMQGETIENEWVADSPGEFREQLRDAFNLGTVKASILAVVGGGADPTPNTGDSTPHAGESTRNTGDSAQSGGETPGGG